MGTPNAYSVPQGTGFSAGPGINRTLGKRPQNLRLAVHVQEDCFLRIIEKSEMPYCARVWSVPVPAICCTQARSSCGD